MISAGLGFSQGGTYENVGNQGPESGGAVPKVYSEGQSGHANSTVCPEMGFFCEQSRTVNMWRAAVSIWDGN